MNPQLWQEIRSEMKECRDRQKCMEILREQGMTEVVTKMPTHKACTAFSPIVVNGWPGMVAVAHLLKNKTELVIMAVPPKWKDEAADFFLICVKMIMRRISEVAGDPIGSDVVEIKNNSSAADPSLN